MAGRGNPNPKGSKPDKLMRDALVLALNREAVNSEGQPTKKLYLIADALVDKAVGGDVQAAKEVIDRVDGRAVQPLEHSGEVETNYVAHAPAPSQTMDAWQTQFGPPTTVQ